MSQIRTPNLLSGLSVFMGGDDPETIALLKTRLIQWGAEIINHPLPTSISLYCHVTNSPPRVTSAYPWTLSDRLAHILAAEAGLDHGYNWRRDKTKISAHLYNLQNEAMGGIIRGLFLWLASYDGYRLHELFNASWDQPVHKLPASQTSEDEDDVISVRNPKPQDKVKTEPVPSSTKIHPVMEGPKYFRPVMNNMAPSSPSAQNITVPTQEDAEGSDHQSEDTVPVQPTKPTKTTYKP